MKTAKVLISGCKGILIFSVIAILMKIILTSYFGYKRVNAEYGGVYFYNWRAKYMDKKLVRSFYVPQKLNEQAYNPVLTRYSDMVQGTTKRHVIGYNPQTKEKQYGRERKEYPYYAYGLPDTFVLNPKRTWEIFKNDPRAFDLEMAFLKLRGNFISDVYGIKFDINNKYFKDKEKIKSKTKTEGVPLLKKTYLKKVPKEKIERFFNAAENQTFINVPEVIQLINKLRKNREKYRVDIINNEAKMSKSLEQELMPIVKNIFSGYEITTRKLNAFFTRLAKIDINLMDTHIIHRFYMLMTYVYSYVSVTGESIAYDKNVSEISRLNKVTGKKTSSEERKLKRLQKNNEKLRYEIILTKISQIIGQSIGDRGIFIDIKGDKRGWIERYGSPQGLKSTKFKKGDRDYVANEKLLDKEFDKIKLV